MCEIAKHKTFMIDCSLAEAGAKQFALLFQVPTADPDSSIGMNLRTLETKLLKSKEEGCSGVASHRGQVRKSNQSKPCIAT